MTRAISGAERLGHARLRSTRRAGGAEKIDEEVVGAGNAFGKLAEEGNAGVDVYTFAVVGIDEGAGQVLFAGIVHGEKWRVFRIELRPEIEAAFLNPAFEVALRDLIRTI